MGILKAMPVILTIAFLLVGMVAMNASARMEARWALQAGNVITGEDISIEHPVAKVFHQQTSTASDLENFKLNYPITDNGIQLGPTTGTTGVDNDLSLGDGATSGIIPEGPVNLAMPDMHQDSSQHVLTSSTGYFNANWAYVADTVAGNQGSEPIGTHLASGHPFKSSKMFGSGLSWPSMMPIASASEGSLGLDAGSVSPGMVPDVPSLQTDVNILKNYQVNNTSSPGPIPHAQNGTGEKLPAGWGQKKPPVNPKMTKEQINSSPVMERVWRNAFIGSTMHKAYEGSTQYPTWIDPYDNGHGVFNPCIKQNCMQLAMNKTKPGAHIAPVFWDL